MTPGKTRLSTLDSFDSFPIRSIRRAKYNEVVKTFNQIVFEKLLTTGDTFVLPNNLGEVYFHKYKPKSHYIDFKKTRLHGKTIRHLNQHSDGYIVTLVWNKGIFKHRKIWEFKLARNLIRLREFSLVKFIKSNSISHIRLK